MMVRCGTGTAKHSGAVLALAVLLCAWAVPLALGAPAEMKAPGEGSSRRPPLGSRVAPDYLAFARRPGASATAAPFTLLLEFYRLAISPVDGDRCDMAPTCSLYARQAFQDHGGVLGFLLTADRLLHEADERPLVRSYTLGREKYYVDPLRANTYWWQGDGR
jgi:hypothetical protein